MSTLRGNASPASGPAASIDTPEPYDYQLVPAEEIAARLTRCREALAGAGLAGAIFSQSVDLFYLSGSAQLGALIVPAAGAGEPVYLVRKSLSRAAAESPLTPQPIGRSGDLPRWLDIAGIAPGGRLGLELDVLPAAQYRALTATLAQWELDDASALIRRQRAVKSAWEIEQLRFAARRTDAIFEAPRTLLRKGLTEIELAAAVEAAARRQGHQGPVRSRAFNQPMYYGHVLSGPSGTIPSYADSSTGGQGLSPAFPASASWRRIGLGEPVSVDCVGVFGGYHVDRTQIYSLGPLPEVARVAFAAMVQIQTDLVALARPGLPVEALFLHGRRRAEELGYAASFLGHGEGQVRFVGHGVGLEVDEWPPIAAGVREPLQAGMVLAIEPKVVLPDIGMVGIEHTWLLTESGLVRLTRAEDAVVELPVA